jgi:ubiquinone/menaquinone biosynthesis C-methylase UbiE
MLMTSEIFDKAAAQWDQNEQRVKLSRRVAAAIRDAVALHAGMTALEIGCGTGLVTMELAGPLQHIVATDSSAGMLESLRQKLAGPAAAKITPMQIDLTAGPAPLAGRTFDLIYSSMTLHHIRDTAGLLRTCHALLNPGGFLAVADLEPEDGSFHGDMPGVEHHGFVPAQLAALAADCGFVNVGSAAIHVIRKQDAEGRPRDYPVFLLTGRRI